MLLYYTIFLSCMLYVVLYVCPSMLTDHTWRRCDMKTLSAFLDLAMGIGNPPVTDGFLLQWTTNVEMLSVVLTWTSCSTNSPVTGDLIRHSSPHCDKNIGRLWLLQTSKRQTGLSSSDLMTKANGRIGRTQCNDTHSLPPEHQERCLNKNSNHPWDPFYWHG